MYLKSVYQHVLQLWLTNIRKNSTLQSRAKEKVFLRCCRQLKKYMYSCAFSGEHLWFLFLIKFSQIMTSFYKDSPDNVHRAAAANLAKETDAIEQLYTTYRSCPKRKKGKPTSSNNYSVIYILLIPENSPDFRKMAREAMRNIVAFSDTHETTFVIIEFNENLESLKSKFNPYVAYGSSCKFYVFGHEHPVRGFIGTKEKGLLRINKLLGCLDDLCIRCQSSTSVTLICCNGHLYTTYPCQKIAIDCVTSDETPFSVYLGKFNISFMCHLFTKHLHNKYNI